VGEKDAREASAHEDFTVGEVDEPEHAVDQRVAHGDHRVQRAVLEAHGEVGPKSGSNLVKP
jgi:hypothetical protein